MTLALDTDVLVHWSMTGAAHHAAARRLVDREPRIALASSVLQEWLHVSTDPRRFERPFDMGSALAEARRLWDAPDVVRVLPGPRTVHRTLELMRAHRLGRTRILDTALVAMLEEAGIRRIATLNGDDYRVFGIEVVDPRS